MTGEPLARVRGTYCQYLATDLSYLYECNWGLHSEVSQKKHQAELNWLSILWQESVHKFGIQEWGHFRWWRARFLPSFSVISPYFHGQERDLVSKSRKGLPNKTTRQNRPDVIEQVSEQWEVEAAQSRFLSGFLTHLTPHTGQLVWFLLGSMSGARQLGPNLLSVLEGSVEQGFCHTQILTVLQIIIHLYLKHPLACLNVFLFVQALYIKNYSSALYLWVYWTGHSNSI